MSEDNFNIESAVASIGSDLFGPSETKEVEVTPVFEQPTAGAETEGDVEVTVDLPEQETTETEPSHPAPKTWRKEALEQWNTLPPVVQAEVLKREEDIFRGLESYKTEATFGKSVNTALAPYMDILRQNNIDPVRQISGLMQTHHTLVFGSPEVKQQLLQRIAADYGIELGSSDSQPFIDPQVKTLMDNVNQLQSKLSQYESAQQQTQIESAKQEIDKFLNDPANIYAKDVVQDMAQLLQSGQAKDLPEAYNKAIWLNEGVREKEVTRRNKETLELQKVKAREKAEAAKKAAAANVSTTAKNASATAPLGTIEDTLQQTLNAIHSRT